MRRPWTRVVAAVALLGGSVLCAAPAEGTNCRAREVQTEMRKGNTLAIVTRTDHRAPPDATFRVEAAYGVDVPATLTGRVDAGMDSQPTAFPGDVVALIFERRGDGWFLSTCSDVDLGEALDLVNGEPDPAAGGPIVAVATGDFGGSRLAGLDARGRVVAWDRRTGHAERVAACPGGRTVVAYGSRPDATVADPMELGVHDAATLRRKRVVLVPPTENGHSGADLRCADERGDVVQVLLTYSGAGAARLVTVDGTRIDTVAISRVLREVVAVADGFLALAYTDQVDLQGTLVRIGSDGDITDLPTAESLSDVYEVLAVAPDGVTVAAFGSRSGVVTFDARTGVVLGRWAHGDLAGAAWTADGHLLVRIGYDTGWGKPREGTMVTLDRRLRELARRPSTPGRYVAAIGDTAVTFGGTRLSATPEGGEARVLPELRLAATAEVVPLSTVSLEPAEQPPTSPAPASGVVRAVRWTPPPTTNGPARAVLVCLAAAALAAAVAGARRPRRSRA